MWVMAGNCRQSCKKLRIMAEEIDLYEDIFLPVNLSSNQDGEDEDPPDLSSAEVKQLKELSAQLSSQNAALKKNISCLYKTAQSELGRKESMIERLMKRIKRLEWNLKTTQAETNGKTLPQTESTLARQVFEAKLQETVETRPHEREDCETGTELPVRSHHDRREKQANGFNREQRRHEKDVSSPSRSSDKTAKLNEYSHRRPRSSDQSERRRVSTLREREESKRKSDLNNRVNSVSAVPSSEPRGRQRERYCHSQERRYHTHDKENQRNGVRRLERKRKCTPSPELPHHRDLRDEVMHKPKHSRRESIPGADHTSSRPLMSTSSLSLSSVQHSPRPATSFEELVEEDLLELEFEDPLPDSSNYSPPSKTTIEGERDTDQVGPIQDEEIHSGQINKLATISRDVTDNHSETSSCDFSPDTREMPASDEATEREEAESEAANINDSAGMDEELEDGEIDDSENDLEMAKRDPNVAARVVTGKRSAIEISREARARRNRTLKASHRHNTSCHSPLRERKPHPRTINQSVSRQQHSKRHRREPIGESSRH